MSKTAASIFLLIFVVQAYGLNLTLYYESLCPDSRRFIINQLTPAYPIVGANLEIQFVPYGNAETKNESDGTLSFTCQHGPNECFGNKVHACLIDQNPNDQDIQVKFISCSMVNASDTTILKNCADSIGLSWDPIQDCLDSGEADRLLAVQGEITDAATPPISWVPSLFFDGEYNATLQWIGEHHFLIATCELLSEKPEGCPK